MPIKETRTENLVLVVVKFADLHSESVISCVKLHHTRVLGYVDPINLIRYYPVENIEVT